MKYFSSASGSLRIYKFFEKFLSDEELRILKGRTITLGDHCHEVLKLTNGLLINYYMLPGSSSLLIVNNANQYFFEPLTEKHLGELIKFSLFDGDRKNFIKIILSKNKLIKSIFDLFSDDVKFWIINKVTKISIWNLNNYQFTEYKNKTHIALSLRVDDKDDRELGVFTKDTADIGVHKSFITRSAGDLPFIASHVNEFIKKRL